MGRCTISRDTHLGDVRTMPTMTKKHRIRLVDPQGGRVNTRIKMKQKPDPLHGELGTLVAREGTGRTLACIDVGAVDPLAQGGLGQVEVLGDLGDAAVADPAQADGLRLEGGRERAAGPLPLDGLSGLVHGALLASFLANLGVHEIEAGSGTRGSHIGSHRWQRKHALQFDASAAPRQNMQPDSANI
jgi:hypothetical protein